MRRGHGGRPARGLCCINIYADARGNTRTTTHHVKQYCTMSDFKHKLHCQFSTGMLGALSIPSSDEQDLYIERVYCNHCSNGAAPLWYESLEQLEASVRRPAEE